MGRNDLLLPGGIVEDVINIEKQVAYWSRGAEEELYTARRLLTKRSTRQCLFFAHLAVEKALKAHICWYAQDIAPRSHNLPYLAGLAGLILTPEQSSDIDRIDDYNLVGRYPDQLQAQLKPTLALARKELRVREEIIQWLMSLLPK
jgi:HEPN domain-containing protein